MTRTNVHTEHCCLKHGCKYGNALCPVATGRQPQSFLCEACEWDIEATATKALDPTYRPMQPVIRVQGTLRFKANPLVRFLLDAGPFDMNQLAAIPCSPEERMQFAQLIGYSLGGYQELSYVTTDEHYLVNEVVRVAKDRSL